jgi:hypothetical protein
VRAVVATTHNLADVGVVVAAVETQPLWPPPGRLRSRDGDRVERRG